jgi:hypothetical protein
MVEASDHGHLYCYNLHNTLCARIAAAVCYNCYITRYARA